MSPATEAPPKEETKEAKKDELHLKAPVISPSQARRGMQVPIGTIPPQGWQVIPMDNGTAVLEFLPPDGFEPEAHRQILKKVDSAYELMLPTEKVPDRKPPTIMLVNKAWRALFKHVPFWGDNHPATIVVVEGDNRLKGDGPQFKFIVEE